MENCCRQIFDALRSGHIKCFHMFVESGVDLNKKDHYDNILLHQAVLDQQIEFVSILINNNVNLDIQDLYGATPLHYASGSDNLELVTLLLDNGANKFISNNFGSLASDFTNNITVKNFINFYNDPLIKEPDQD